MDDTIPPRSTSGAIALVRRGFTLVELMIVIALVAILAAMAAPTVSNSMEQNRVTDLNRAVANGFLEARQFAMRQNQAVFAQVNEGPDGQIIFYEPGNWGGAQTCGLADDQGPGGGRTLNEVNLADYGLDIEIDSVDPVNLVCISPAGRVVGPNGIPLGGVQNGDGCDEMNLVIRLIDEGRDRGNLHDCEGDDDQAIDRELANFSMIHVGYGGQVRVIR